MYYRLPDFLHVVIHLHYEHESQCEAECEEISLSTDKETTTDNVGPYR